MRQTKTWRLVKLILLSRAPPNERAKAALRLIRARADHGFCLQHIAALKLPPPAATELARSAGIEFSAADLVRHRIARSPQDMVALAESSHAPSVDDIVDLPRCAPEDKARAIESLGMMLTWDQARRLCAGSSSAMRPATLKLIREPPTRDEILSFMMTSDRSLKQMAVLLRHYGHEPEYLDFFFVAHPLMRKRDIFAELEDAGVTAPSQILRDLRFPVDILVRQMWKQACPLIFGYNMSAPPAASYYLPDERLSVLRAKAAIRCIQRFGRHIRRTRAATRIQREWRRAISDPLRSLARTRLAREFAALGPDFFI